MSKTKKESTAFTCRMEASLFDQLSTVSQATRIPKTALVEMALSEYFDRNFPIGQEVGPHEQKSTDD